MDDMRDRIVAAAKRHKNECAEFLRELIAIPSESQHEEEVAAYVRREMIKLGYDSAEVDRFGNVIGTIGTGDTHLLFDAHMDTTGIGDRSTWRFDPYRGELKAGKVYGHGATNNKGGLAAVVYAGGIIAELDLANQCTVHVVASIQAEECEGLAYKSLFDVEKLRPHYVVLTMPTGMRLCRGHRGRVEIEVMIRGQVAHASDVTKGSNAIYAMSRIILGVQKLNETLPSDPFLGKATVAVTHIECDNNGPNSLPETCRIIIDRRLVPGENVKKALQQIRDLTKGTKAKVEVIEFDKPSYKGLRFPMQKQFPTWTLEENHPLIESVENAYRSIMKKKPPIDRWTMSTAGTYTMGIAGVPTVGLGPSEESYSGPINDHVRIDDLEKCMAIYASIPGSLPEADGRIASKR